MTDKSVSVGKELEHVFYHLKKSVVDEVWLSAANGGWQVKKTATNDDLLGTGFVSKKNLIAAIHIYMRGWRDKSDAIENARVEQYEFFILGYVDSPIPRMVLQSVGIVDGIDAMKYMNPELMSSGYVYSSKGATNLKDFGFEVRITLDRAHFVQVRESTAKYADGQPRRWQGDRVFELKLIPMEGQWQSY